MTDVSVEFQSTIVLKKGRTALLAQTGFIEASTFCYPLDLASLPLFFFFYLVGDEVLLYLFEVGISVVIAV